MASIPRLVRGSSFAVVALLATGCSSVARVAVVPNVDTEGGVGVEGRLTLGLGVTTQFDPEKETTDGEPVPRIDMIGVPQVSGVGGLRVKGQTLGEVGVETSIDYASIGRDPGRLGFRGGFFGGYKYEEQFGSRGTVGLSSGLLWTVARVSSNAANTRIALGPVGEAAIIASDKPGYARFGLGLDVAAYKFTAWTVR